MCSIWALGILRHIGCHWDTVASSFRISIINDSLPYRASRKAMFGPFGLGIHHAAQSSVLVTLLVIVWRAHLCRHHVRIEPYCSKQLCFGRHVSCTELLLPHRASTQHMVPVASESGYVAHSCCKLPPATFWQGHLDHQNLG